MGHPEPGILNPDAIMMWNMGGDNSGVVRRIEELVSHPKMLDEFLRQPRLVEGAEDRIVAMITALEDKICSLFKD